MTGEEASEGRVVAEALGGRVGVVASGVRVGAVASGGTGVGVGRAVWNGASCGDACEMGAGLDE